MKPAMSMATARRGLRAGVGMAAWVMAVLLAGWVMAGQVAIGDGATLIDFEGESVQTGLTTLTVGGAEVTVEIHRTAGGTFSIRDLDSATMTPPDSWGSRCLSPGTAAPTANDWFVITFSQPVTGVSIELTDAGGDLDLAEMRVYSGPDSTGTLLSTEIYDWADGSSPDYATLSYSLPYYLASFGIQSIVVRGGSTAYPNSMYIDNLLVWNDSDGEPAWGRVLAWGGNARGQLGDGTTTDRHGPIEVIGLADVVAVAGGEAHSVALRSDGTVWAWGANDQGQLGDGTTQDRLTPVQVAGLAGVVKVASGERHTLAVVSDGGLWTWGDNDQGQLGDGTTGDRSTPARVAGLGVVISMDGGAGHSAAVLSDGTVWTWGANDRGQLGDGTTAERYVPGQVTDLEGMSEVACGRAHTLAVSRYFQHYWLMTSTIWAWGANDRGQLGDETWTDQLTPVELIGTEEEGYLLPIERIAAAGDVSLAAVAAGVMWTWGANDQGQLGDGLTTDRNIPTVVPDFYSTGAATTGGNHMVATWFYGGTWAWGDNASGQLGDGSTVDSPIPVEVLGVNEYAALAAGAQHSLAAVTGWQDRYTVTATVTSGVGSLVVRGDAPWSYSFAFGEWVTVTATPGLVSWSGLPAGARVDGNRASFYMTEDVEVGAVFADPGPGTIVAWGHNYYGQFGTGLADDWGGGIAQVAGLEGVTSVSAGLYHSAAVCSDGTVWAWGYNYYGQLGDGTRDDHYLPEQVPGAEGMVAVSAGSAHTLALRSDGTVWAWGYNGSGALGDGTSLGHLTPVKANGLAGAVGISAGEDYSAAVLSDGTVWTWGSNYRGQLGDGSTTVRYSPVQVPGLSGGVDVSAGKWHTLAVLSDGTAKAWGYNGHGQLGDGTLNDHLTPNPVGGLEGVVRVSAGIWHSVALRSDGTVWGWGQNYEGQLGDGTEENQFLPVQAVGLNEVVDVAAGMNSTVFLRADGSVWQSGWMWYDGDWYSLSVPTMVLTGMTAIAAADQHQLAVASPVAGFQVQVSTAGMGEANAVPGEETYRYGECVVVEALPMTGWVFNGWTCTGGAVFCSTMPRTALLVTGDTQLVANFVPEGGATLEITDLALSSNWVYQNAANSTGDDGSATTGHRVTLTVAVADGFDNSSYTVAVSQSGTGAVRVLDGQSDLEKVIKGSFRTDGIAGTGACQLHVTVTGDVEGTASGDVVLDVRRLGDIDGSGAVVTADAVELTRRLNNLVAGLEQYDLDASGAVTTADGVLLTKILNNLTID